MKTTKMPMLNIANATVVDIATYEEFDEVLILGEDENDNDIIGTNKGG